MSTYGTCDSTDLQEIGLVVTADKDKLWIRTRNKSTCDHCQTRDGCGVSLMERLLGKKRDHFLLPNTIDAKAGDTVILSVDERSLIKASLLAYLLPLMFMALGAVALNVKGDLFALAGAGVGLMFGFMLARMISRSTMARHFTPHLIRSADADTAKFYPASEV